MLPAGKEYETWTKAQLVQRIRMLESPLVLEPKSEDIALEKCDGEETSGKGEKSKLDGGMKALKKRKFDFSKFETRFVALRFAYMGWNYNGLNYQQEPTPLPTVEQEILDAMTTAKLIPSADPASCNFSRCGRTDKGVSALNQVISLDIRSNLRKEDHGKKEFDIKELPYISILNSLLPTDIRITAVSLRPPPGFDARFSCTYRHYKYIFKKDGLDIDLMLQAAAMYEGPHDFRNFCKVDGSKQITNHVREVYSAKIIPLNEDFYVFDLKGSAFLWHQVRCMIAILFLVGQKLEAASIVTDLLNVEKFPSKPAYEMANDIPLVLYDCVFPEMEWLTLENDFEGKQKHKLRKEYNLYNGLLLDYQLKANVAKLMAETYLQSADVIKHNTEGGSVNIGNGNGRNFKNYIPLANRELGETVEVINRRHREKKQRKQADAESIKSIEN